MAKSKKKTDKPYDVVYENKLFKPCGILKCKQEGCQESKNGKSDEFKFLFCPKSSEVIKYIKKKKE